MSDDRARKVIAIFQQLDDDATGSIDQADLKAILQALDPERWNDDFVKSLLAAYGRVKDEQVRYEDFFGWIIGNKWDLVKTSGRLHDSYEIGEELGRGGFGTVRKVFHKATKVVRAVKSIPRNLDGDGEISQKDLLDAEILVMKQMDNPNIVQLFDVFEDNVFLHLVIELCTGGTLLEKIVSDPDWRFAEQQVCSIMKQVFGVVNYMHSLHVCHRDMKLENLLLLEKCPIDKCVVKVVDFGLSRKCPPGTYMTTLIGTASYLAPEVLTKQYTTKCDLWSCGVIMYILLTGTPPFKGSTDTETLAKVQTGEVDFSSGCLPSLTQECQKFLRGLLNVDPDSRLTAEQALSHPWSLEVPTETTERLLEHNELQSMQAFCNGNKLKKAARNVIAKRLAATEIEDLKQQFFALDKNKDGVVTFQELKNGISKLGDAGKSLLDSLAFIDIDWDGAIEYTEFLAAAMSKKKYGEERVCWEAFQVFDLDGSGQITRNELMKVLHCQDVEDIMGSIAIARVMEQCDTDGGGTIDFQEFMSMMRSD